MHIYHLRNATFVIESGENFILIDPMLSKKGKLPPFAIIRHKPKRNPTVSLPENTILGVKHNIRGHVFILDKKYFGSQKKFGTKLNSSRMRT